MWYRGECDPCIVNLARCMDTWEDLMLDNLGRVDLASYIQDWISLDGSDSRHIIPLVM